MATAESQFLEKINENFLVCGICNERYRTSKQLPCLHSFCEKCLLAWVEKSGELGCPVCRRTYQLPDGGVTKLQSNFFLDQLVEQFNQRDADSGKSSCDGCDVALKGGENGVRCQECSMTLCEACARTHKRIPLTRSHRPIPVHEYHSVKTKDPATVQSGIYCEHHADSQVKFYCETCQEPICSDCTVIDHRIPEHEHKYLKDAAAEYKEGVETTVKQLKVKEQEASASRGAVEKMAERLDDSFHGEEKKLNDHVTKTIKEVTRMIEDAGKQLFQQLQGEYAVRKADLTAQVRDLDRAQCDLANAREFTENLAQYANPAQLMSAKKGVATQTRELLNVQTECYPVADDFMEFRPCEDFFARRSLGTVRLLDCTCTLTDVSQFCRSGDIARASLTVKGRKKPTTDEIEAEIKDPTGQKEKMTVNDCKDGTFSFQGRVHREGEHTVSVSVCKKLVCSSPLKVIPQKGLMCKFGSKGKGEGELGGPWGVTLDGRGNVVVCEYGNERMQLFALQDKRGTVIKNSGYTKSYYPRYTAVSKDRRLRFITESTLSGNQVLIFDINWQFIKSFKGDIAYPRGIGISPTNSRVHVVDHNSHCIRLFDQDGNQIKSLGSRGSGEGQFEYPEGVCINGDGNVIVGDYGNHRIQVFDADGKFLFAFGSQGNGEGQMKYPRGVATDKRNNVYVCDRGNNRVLKFDSKGKYICRIDSDKDGSIDPLDVCVTDDEPFGKVIVSDYSGGCIHVFAQ